VEKIKLPPGFQISLYALVPGCTAYGCGSSGHRDLRWNA
jgi:hypothetical protein